VSLDEVVPQQREASPRVLLDATDERILSLLCEDGRMSMRTLAERCGVSRASAYVRVQRLREAGVVLGFTARLDPAQLGLAVTAHVHVHLQQHRWRVVVEALRRLPEVAYCAARAADDDVLLIVRVPDVEALHDVLRRVHRRTEVLRTRTVLVLDDSSASDAAALENALEWSRHPA
jgi:DNA-binding Lrp family transcriptional regulator